MSLQWEEISIFQIAFVILKTFIKQIEIVQTRKKFSFNLVLFNIIEKLLIIIFLNQKCCNVYIQCNELMIKRS